MRRLWLGIALALATGCAGSPPASRTTPSSSLVAAGWSQASLDLDAVDFDCARATDTPEALRATAGAGATHAQEMALCRERLAAASADLRSYDRALAQARDLPLMDRERLHALAGQLAGLLEAARRAALAEDLGMLAGVRLQIAEVEGKMLAALRLRQVDRG